MEQKTLELHFNVRLQLYNRMVAASYLLTDCAIYDTIEQVQQTRIVTSARA